MIRSQPALLAISAICILWMAWLDQPPPQPIRFRHDRNAKGQELCVIEAIAIQARYEVGPENVPIEVDIPARAMTSAATHRTIRWFRMPNRFNLDLVVAVP